MVLLMTMMTMMTVMLMVMMAMVCFGLVPGDVVVPGADLQF